MTGLCGSSLSRERLREALAACRSTLAEPACVPGDFPMYVVPFDHFMKMKEVKSHQELLAEGVLVDFEDSMGDAIFVSHQWVGFSHPDPDFAQLRVLQGAFERLLSSQESIKSGPIQFAFLGHGEYISTRDWQSSKLFVWYDFFSCPQLVARTEEQDSVSDLQRAVDSIGRYVQACKYFVALVPCVQHVDTGELLSREDWQSRGWCRFERVCREFLGADPNIACIQSIRHSKIMMPFDSWLRPACMGHFTVQSDRDKVQRLISGMLHTKLVSLLQNSDLHGFRMVLNLQHVYLRTTDGDRHADKPQLAHFMRENGFETLTERQFGWKPVSFAAMRGNTQILQEMLACRASVNEAVKATEARFHVDKGVTLLSLCAQFCNLSAMRLLIERKADVNARDSLGCTALHRAALGNNVEGVQMLIQACCRPHLMDGFGNNALVVGAVYATAEWFKALMKLAPDTATSNALHFASFGEGTPLEIIPELLAAGADINQKFTTTRKQRIEFQLLARIAKCFSAQHGDNIFFFLTNVIGATPLICSVMMCNFPSAAILIAAGADPMARNAAGKSAIDMAEAVLAPDFIMKGLQGDLAACDQHVSPEVAQKIWVCI